MMTKGNKTCVPRETVYDRCAYIGCYNGKYINGRRLFHFPSETDRRLEMWIERSGNFRLRTWAATSLRKAGLCGDHFDDKCFTDATQKALRRNVVPRHYTEDRKFRKSNGGNATENNENNENNKNDTATEEDEDDPLNCDNLVSNPVESTVTVETNGITEDSSLPSDEFVINEANIKTGGDRTPSPVVEFIVEELDESLIFEESCKSERPCSLEPESSVDDSIFEYEEKVNLQNVQSCEQSSPMRLEETENATIPSVSGLRVNRSDSDVRTYYRSKNHRQPKLELASGESEAITDEELAAPVETNPQLNAFKVVPRYVQNNTVYLNKRAEKMLTKYRDDNKQLRSTMRVLKQKIRRAKARETNYMQAREILKNVDVFLDIQECTNPVARAMVKIALHKRNTPYTKEEKDFATQLYRYSSNAFDRLKNAGCNFPGKSTIRRWISENDGEPSACDFMMAVVAEEEEEQFVEDFQEIDQNIMMVEEGEEIMEDAVEDAEDAIDELVERLEEQIEDAEVGHKEYIEEILPDEEDEEVFK